MIKISIITLLLSATLFSVEIPISHTKLHSFGKSVELNSKVIQLSNAKQSVTSLISGHLEKYFVEAGQYVKAGQKIALIESIEISKMTADYISLKEQYLSLSNNYKASKNLYDKGMLAMQELNNLTIEKNAMNSKIIGLESQLHTLDIDIKNLKEATSNFILYAHSSGRVSKLHKPLHAIIREDETLISIIKNYAFYIQSYLPLQYAGVVKVGQKLTIDYHGRTIVTHVTQVLPELDLKTQRVVVLSSVDEKADDLFINTFVKSTLYFEPKDKYVAIKKSALSFFNNEWVVFVPVVDEHDEKESEHSHDSHADLDSDMHDEHDDHEGHGDEESEHKEHASLDDSDEGHHEDEKEDAHGHEEEESSMLYEPRVVEIITQDDNFVGVNGLEVGEKYVSDKSYYAKSLILKSALGGHGH